MISIVIPTFNEAGNLPATLGALEREEAEHEVIIVDAHSTDGTLAVGESFECILISSERRQRAAQMNLGASAAHGDVLLFLHGDTQLHPGALSKIEGALRRPALLGGGFARRYASPSVFLRMTCAFAELRTRAFGWFLGDQAIFVRRASFEALGGFREWDVFEDLDFSRRMARAGHVTTLRPPVISSARRFTTRGAVLTTWGDFWLTARYLAGRIPDSGNSSQEEFRSLTSSLP
jgi:rSAM/selenodomain-associated transferase 2